MSPIEDIRIINSLRTPDDQPLFTIRKDFSSGVNTRQDPSSIGETQAVVIYNLDLGVQGQARKRAGSVLIGNDVGDESVLALHNYEIQGETDQLLMAEDDNLWSWTGTGNWNSIDLSALTYTAQDEVGMVSIKQSGIAPDDIVVVQNGVDNPFTVDKDGAVVDLGDTSGTGSDSPPISTVMAWYGNRLWVLKNDLLYFSDAYAADYSDCFDTVTNVFRLPIGEERKIISTRGTGMVVMGREQIWGLNPSAVPAATDKPEPLITNMGVVSKNGAVAYGDSIYFFSQDGFRELKRTLQDKLQVGISYPISYRLKNEYERIAWAYIHKLSIKAWDNKIFIAVPTGATTFDTWVYYPALDSFMIIQGWSPTCWATYKVEGEERLYYGKEGDGTVYRAWYGLTDEGEDTDDGTVVEIEFHSRQEDMGQPLIHKNGGEIEIKFASANYSDVVDVSVSKDGEGWVTVGSLTLGVLGQPLLPIYLPFNLVDSSVVPQKFHLEKVGRWKTLQVKLTSSTENTDPIVFYSYSIITFGEAYENE